MSDLLQSLNKILVKEVGLKFAQKQTMASTGFRVLDYFNGTYSPSQGTIRTGIDNGKIVQIIGKSGSGKSTLAIQMAANIVNQHEHSSVFHFDIETATSSDRVMGVTGYTQEQFNNKWNLIDTGIYAETLFNTLAKVHKWKLQNKEHLMYDTGVKDDNGDPIMEYQPTVFLLDSLAMLMPQSIEGSEELKGQMIATQAAKANTQLFKRITSLGKEANIIVIFINHITTNIGIGVTPPASLINYLKQDEALPGGKAAIYLTNTLIKVEPKTKLTEDKTLKIKGFMAELTIIKSRTAPAGTKFTLVFDQTNGFMESLSLLEYLKAAKLILGGGRSYYVVGMEDRKFSLGTFKDRYDDEEDFRNHVHKVAEASLADIIKHPDRITAMEEEVVEEEPEADEL